MALILFQEPDALRKGLSRARPLHTAKEIKEHTATPERREADYALRDRVLL